MQKIPARHFPTYQLHRRVVSEGADCGSPAAVWALTQILSDGVVSGQSGQQDKARHGVSEG